MIIWIASYPKSGNTYLRSFLASYYFTKNGKFEFNLLNNINHFPGTQYSNKKITNEAEASKNWISFQEKYFDKDKLHFLKTHNSLISYNENNFTTKRQTLGAIYIVRDPRSVIISSAHHYSLNYEMALQYMIDPQKSLLVKSVDEDFSNFTFLSSWSNHYKSWIKNSDFKLLFIRYEDLEDNKYEIFRDIIIFIETLTKKNIKVDKEKLLESIKTTNFNVLKNKEKNEGFQESSYSKETGKKIDFFNKGFNNRWQKILPDEIKKKASDLFKDDLMFLNYKI